MNPEQERSSHLLKITGTVQGVGFRPFVARLAREWQLNGWVRNDESGVTIRLFHDRSLVDSFAEALYQNKPVVAQIDSLVVIPEEGCQDEYLPPAGEAFTIRESPQSSSSPSASVTPDLAICEDCLRELLDPENRRYQYPFINCTNCGPRYSIITELPYDRKTTTMSTFQMCDACRKEYEDPYDRRYHAQPNACPDCGPQITLLSKANAVLADAEHAISEAVAKLREGHIVAAKGIGGYHLLVDALNDEAVRRLRQRKQRDGKPFAVMFPSESSLRQYTIVSHEELNLLQSPAAPVVLVKSRHDNTLSAQVAPANPYIGALLPYAPLHVLIMNSFAGPVVATSANLSEEPLCTDNAEAIERLSGIADSILVHDRPIARPVDDSVQRFTTNESIFLRRARGYAPTPFRMPKGIHLEKELLCVGGHLKNTIAFARENQVFLSPHIGDLSNSLAIQTFRETIRLLSQLYGGAYSKVACDLHPDYISTQYAESLELPLFKVQHHVAHIISCLLEHENVPDKVLGVAWDGTGYGTDGTIWGGEFITIDTTKRSWKRVGRLRPFPLPGGEAAVKDTSRSALGALYAANLQETPSGASIIDDLVAAVGVNRDLLFQIIRRKVNAPLTSSAGRLFDVAAAIIGTARYNSFEGQAGMSLEFAAEACPDDVSPLPFELTESDGLQEIDWSQMLEGLCGGKLSGHPKELLALQTHKTLAEMITHSARVFGIKTVVLSGGCFQNATLCKLTSEGLRAAGFCVLNHHLIPANDNGLAAGQALAAAWNLQMEG